MLVEICKHAKDRSIRLSFFLVSVKIKHQQDLFNDIDEARSIHHEVLEPPQEREAGTPPQQIDYFVIKEQDEENSYILMRPKLLLKSSIRNAPIREEDDKKVYPGRVCSETSTVGHVAKLFLEFITRNNCRRSPSTTKIMHYFEFLHLFL